jgi:hypothetical protein
MYKGRIVDIVEALQTNREQVGLLMAGVDRVSKEDGAGSRAATAAAGQDTEANPAF